MLMRAHVPAYLRNVEQQPPMLAGEHMHARVCVSIMMKVSHSKISPGIFMMPPPFGLIAK